MSFRPIHVSALIMPVTRSSSVESVIVARSAPRSPLTRQPSTMPSLPAETLGLTLQLSLT